MAIAMIMDFPNATMQQYDAVLEALNLGGKLPAGGVFHVAGEMDGGGFRVVDVWESQDAFDAFRKAKLQKAMDDAGIEAPRVQSWEVHHTMHGD